MATVRVRFAPSPTGFLHIGGARTALFNWLYARKNTGTFVLRIEDTDTERSTDESVQAILEGLTWLGLNWDEGPGVEGRVGPYFQSQRLEIYQPYLNQLLAQGHAYYCYCTAEEVEARRQRARDKGGIPRYDGKCRDLSPSDQQNYLDQGRSRVIRFRVPKGETLMSDLIRGRTVFQNHTLEDFVIQKSDGLPTYNFAVVIDDALMDITHVIRGDDHIANTPRQILIYQALGFALPAFAHIPMILGTDRSRLSKRHGATAVTQYRDEGYLPEALLNYLALLGWSYDGSQQIFSVPEMVTKFTLEKVSKNPAIFDGDKLVWLNGQYIRGMAKDEFIRRGLPYLVQGGVVSIPLTERETLIWNQVAPLIQEKLKLMTQIPGACDFFFFEEITWTQDALATIFDNEIAVNLLSNVCSKWRMMDEFTPEVIEKSVREYADELGIKAASLIHPLRAALTGKTVSPGIFELAAILGKDVCIRRIEQVLSQKTQ
jgi:glutamyl-tRNA synthetase